MATTNIPQQQTPHGAEEPLPIELGLTRPTPVYGTAQPAGGVIGSVRAHAYRYPTHNPNHWMLLLAADRLEVGASLGSDLVAPGRQGQVFRHFARQARSYPRGFTAAALLAAALTWWALRR